MLVLDNSGSMEADFDGCYPTEVWCFIAPRKIDSAKAALANFIGRANSTFDQIGLTTYRTSVNTRQTLTSVYGAGSNLQDILTNSVDIIAPPFGGTSIGNGVLEAWVELNSGRARPEARKYMILATDGLQRDGRSIYTDVTLLDEFGVPVTNTVLEWLELSGVKVFSIAVGNAATFPLQTTPLCRDEISQGFLADEPVILVGADNYCPYPEIDSGASYLRDISCRTNRDPVDPGDPPSVGGVPNWPRNCSDPTQSDPDLPGFNNYFLAPDDGDLDDVYETIQDLISQDLFMGLIDQLNSAIFEPLPGPPAELLDAAIVYPAPGLPINEVAHGSPCDGSGTAILPTAFSFDPHFTEPSPPPALVDVISVHFGVIPEGFDYCLTIKAKVKAGANIDINQKVDNPPLPFPPFDGPGIDQACYGTALDSNGDILPIVGCSPTPRVTILPPFEPWIQTEGGDVGVFDVSGADIKVERGPNFGEALTGGQTHSDFLVTIEGSNLNSDNFTSARDWLVESYPYVTTGSYTPLEASADIYDSLINLYSSRGIDDVDLDTSNLFSAASNGSINDVASTSSSGILSYTGDVVFDDSANYTGDPAVVFINGKLNIDKEVKIHSDTGLIFIVSGDIVVDDSVTEIDGFYIANGIFDSGNSSNQLVINGAAISFGGFDLGDRRSSNNETIPAELIKYEPKYLYLLRDIAGIAVETFRELAP